MGGQIDPRLVIDQELPVSGLRPGDQTGHATRRRLAGGDHRRRRHRGTTSLAHILLEGQGSAGCTVSVNEIRSGSILPASREPVTLNTADGLELVGELALPESREPVATLIALHPLPTAGGFMDSHVIRKASFRLPALVDVAVLRFNTRGTESRHGRSEGAFDDGRNEQHDVQAALAFATVRALPRVWWLAWSFGTDLALRYGCEPGVVGAVLLSPPLRSAGDEDLDRWAASGKPMKVLVPEHDDFLQPAEAKARFRRVPQAQVEGVPGAKHLWVGEKYVKLVLDRVVAAVVSGSHPLPTTWDGPMQEDMVPT